MSPDQIALATRRTIEGVPTREIAREIGVAAHTTVSRAMAKPEIRALIESAAVRLITEALDDSVTTAARLAKIGTTTEDKDWAKLGLDASKYVMSVPGVSGQAPSTIITQLIQVNQAPQQSRELDGLAAFLTQHWGVDTKDTVEIVDCVESIQVDRKYPEEKTGIEASHTEAATDGQE